MKKNLIPLNEKQRQLVESCLSNGRLTVVHQAIREYIVVNETIFGFGYEDLYQEGCIWLCKAAATFQEEKGVKFETYAFKVVANGLRTYCRLMCSKQKRQCTLPLYADEEDGQLGMEQLLAEDHTEDFISDMDTLQLLHTLKAQYSGTVKLGIEAIEWKVKGLTGKEIADMYGVKPNLVGAWISRAASRLKQNPVFLQAFADRVEKQPQ